jgi:hypothetical protein
MSRRFLTPLNVLHLASAPSSPSLGDLYFNTTDGALYTFDGTTWVTGVGVQGTQGIQGVQGFDGVQGTQGIQGDAGSALIEIDGGNATSNYGGITSIDAGTATG